VTFPALTCCGCAECDCDCATNLPASITLTLDTPYQILNRDETFTTISSYTLTRTGCCYRGYNFDGVHPIILDFDCYPTSACGDNGDQRTTGIRERCYEYRWLWYKLQKIRCDESNAYLKQVAGQWIWCESLYISPMGGWERSGNCDACYEKPYDDCVPWCGPPYCTTAIPEIQYPTWWDDSCDPAPCPDSGAGFTNYFGTALRTSSGGKIYRACGLVGRHVNQRGTFS
jgi:hypothetical protein